MLTGVIIVNPMLIMLYLNYLDRCHMKSYLNKNKYIKYLIIIDLILCIFLFTKGIPVGQDLSYHLSRIDGLTNSIRSGNFLGYIHFVSGLPKSINVNNMAAMINENMGNYGYANGLFYGNLFLYLPAILSLLGLSVIISYKILIVILMLLTSLIMYYVTDKIFNNKRVAFISSLLYTTCSYHMTDVVIRAALGEILAYMLVPLTLLGLYYILFDDKKKWYIFPISFFLLVNSHLITSFMMVIIYLFIIIFNIRRLFKEKRFKYLVYSILLGTLLSSFFIFPLIEQLLSDKFVLNNLSLLPSERALPIYKVLLGIRFNFYIYDIEFIPAGIGLLFIIPLFFIKKVKENKFIKICMITGLISLLCVTNIFPWKYFDKVFSFIQFPWRFYLPATLFLSFSSAYILNYIIKSKKGFKYLTIYTVLIGFIITFQAFIGLKYTIEDTHDYFYISSGEYLPLKSVPINLDNKFVTSSDDIKYYVRKRDLEVYLNYYNGNNGYIDVPMFYYKGYEARSLLTNELYKIEKGNNNLIRINLKDKDKVRLYYKGTITQKVSLVISLITVTTLLIIYYKKNKDRIITNYLYIKYNRRVHK